MYTPTKHHQSFTNRPPTYAYPIWPDVLEAPSADPPESPGTITISSPLATHPASLNAPTQLTSRDFIGATSADPRHI